VSRDAPPGPGFVRRNAWPIGIFAIIAGFFIAQGILIANAFSDAGFGPEADYYEKALRHDDVMVATRRAHDAGLRVGLAFAEAPLKHMPRRVDVRITDGAGQPVSGLTGTLTAIRPSDMRLRNQADLVGVPDQPGLYRLLLRLPVPGLWIFELDARHGADAYRVVMREEVGK
jgi:hypothetical protein